MDSAALRRRAAENLSSVQAQIDAASQGRSVALVCVTKYAQDEWVRALIEAGAENLAENLLPRAAERFDELWAEGYRFRRHLIGPPQSRKVKQIPGHFDMVQAVDRLKIARLLNELQAERGEQLDVLLQVNISREPQKHGVAPEETAEAYGAIREQCPALTLRGLMAVPPWPDAYPDMAEFEAGTREFFRQMSRLFAKMRELYRGTPEVDTLSLGMSLDYVWAVEEGATMVRVGSALFEGLEG
jgi:pyridoxal phosphate enzyme (YggS family)